MSVNYNDERFQEVKAEEANAKAEYGKLVDGMVSNSDKYYDALIDNSKDWAETQSQLQQEKTDFAIEEIEQQKEQTKKDYTKEQSGAYVDWQKQSNDYGVNAEQQASLGMSNTGYSESSQVQMYTAYQNRIATARESYNRAILNYNNAITEARLQNNSILAEIAYTALQQQLELSLQGFQYKNELLLKKADKMLDIDQMYHQRYQDVLSQINTETALAEQIRQYNTSLASKSSRSGIGNSGSSVSSSNSKPSVTTYEEAVAYLNKNGTKGDGGLMTRSEWYSRKNRGGSGAEMAYSTYTEYLNAFLDWKV